MQKSAVCYFGNTFTWTNTPTALVTKEMFSSFQLSFSPSVKLWILLIARTREKTHWKEDSTKHPYSSSTSLSSSHIPERSSHEVVTCAPDESSQPHPEGWRYGRQGALKSQAGSCFFGTAWTKQTRGHASVICLVMWLATTRLCLPVWLQPSEGSREQRKHTLHAHTHTHTTHTHTNTHNHAHILTQCR